MVKNCHLVDLSLPIRDGGAFRAPAQITYKGHRERGLSISQTFDIDLSLLKDGKANATEEFTYLSTHMGTHLDSPWHCGETSEGKRSLTINEVPLERCLGDGVVLDLSYKKPSEGISAKETEEALKEIGYTLKPMDIVLIRTGASAYYGKPGYANMHPGMTAESTLWLADQGIRVVGIDAGCWDRPPEIMINELKQGIKGKYMEAHLAAGERGMCIIEWLTNLDILPPYGFRVCVFPIKIEGGSAGWVRAVAFIEE